MTSKKSRNAARLRRHVRVRQNVSGTSQRPRLNVFRSLSEIYAQVIDDESGNTIVSASTIDMNLRSDMEGKNKTEQARLVGEVLAERAKEKGAGRTPWC